MTTPIAAFLLIVTGIYTGSMAPGVDVTVQFKADGIESWQDCRDLGVGFHRTMARFGATSISIECKRQ